MRMTQDSLNLNSWMAFWGRIYLIQSSFLGRIPNPGGLVAMAGSDSRKSCVGSTTNPPLIQRPNAWISTVIDPKHVAGGSHFWLIGAVNHMSYKMLNKKLAAPQIRSENK